ncbi:MAG: DUF1902 domain-containing protein [Rhizobiales bacterium]|nr:DUF1902 domain-containing protein [Hyphomicrobiales bacterium]
MSTVEALSVVVSHDKQEGVWYILSSDIPGLHAEAETLDDLVTVVADIAPDLISANLPNTAKDSPICIQHVVGANPAEAA